MCIDVWWYVISRKFKNYRAILSDNAEMGHSSSKMDGLGMVRVTKWMGCFFYYFKYFQVSSNAFYGFPTLTWKVSAFPLPFAPNLTHFHLISVWSCPANWTPVHFVSHHKQKKHAFEAMQARTVARRSQALSVLFGTEGGVWMFLLAEPSACRRKRTAELFRWVTARSAC